MLSSQLVKDNFLNNFLSIFQENSALCDHIADVQETIDVVKQEREFLLRKLVEHEPSTVDLIQQQNEPKYKKRKNSSSDASSIHKPYAKKTKVQQSLLKKQTVVQSPIPKLPVVINGITLLNLGRIVVDRAAYHTDNCIYPVGYKISRIYNGKMIVCRVIDNGMAPLFEAFLASDPSSSFSGHTTDYCHAEFLQAFENISMPYVLDGGKFISKFP